ncbi:MAG: hypothetical protein A3K12_13465 [Candidatus Rokubacteria bacterium RIFCSPLOWO2_12_FULL_71_19]|nr:MAG: hypothetical protein A3K12_13465 [Candidatus Rokubacteria bacterium RIFCSPLOWO2_12_FULL_71_19]
MPGPPSPAEGRLSPPPGLAASPPPPAAAPAARMANDVPLLERMLADMGAADPLFRPTSFWEHHEPRTVAWLREHDINRFREAGHGLSAAFGAQHYVSLPWGPERLRRLEGLDRSLLVRLLGGRLLGPAARWVEAARLFDPLTAIGLIKKLRKSAETLQALTHHCAELLDRDGTLSRIEDSGLGNPSDLFVADGRRYTFGFLKRFSEYAYVRGAVDWDRVGSVLEIGPGYGGQAELLLKAHPHLRVCIVDIPPQLYVANQYLSACFGRSVLGYKEAAEAGTLEASVLDRYRVVCLAPWQLPALRGVSFDLFWNSASFQEMEPAVVENYAGYVQRLVSGWLYLMNRPGGTRLASGGKHGVREPVVLEHYLRFFSEFALVDRRPARVLPRVQAGEVYDQMLFRRRGAAGSREP